MNPFLSWSRQIQALAVGFVIGLAAISGLEPREALGLEKLRVALTTKDFGYLPLFVGMRAGYFQLEGFEIQWIQIRSNVIASALLAAEVDIGASAGSAMRAAVRGVPMKAIFFPYQRCTFVLMGAPGIKRVDELKGKVIGTTAPGSTTEIAANMVLEHYGLDPKKDVSYFSAGGAETSVLAMQQGIIQARALNPDAAFLLKKKGFTVLAVLADLGPWPWGGYATTTAKLTQERGKIKRWTRAMVRSLLHMANKREETIAIAVKEFGHPRDVAEGALEVSVKAIDRGNPGGATEESLKRNIELTIAQPLKLKEAPSSAGLVDLSLVREVHAELGVKGK